MKKTILITLVVALGFGSSFAQNNVPVVKPVTPANQVQPVNPKQLVNPNKPAPVVNSNVKVKPTNSAQQLQQQKHRLNPPPPASTSVPSKSITK